ncbi:MAG: radical SAM protein [Syntrophobacteraceae bacterium]|nr:radical SAM protein [Syntrophobacteraceae bacterium]
MKVALIFPPAMHPTSPPLGISTLKAFLKEKNPGCSVRLWDLNLACYRKALEWMREEKLRIRLRDLDAGTTLARVEEAYAFFRGRAGMEAFFDLSRYNAAAGLYRRFEQVLHGLLENFARRILVGEEVPSLAERFFRELIEPVAAERPDLIGFSVLFSQQIFLTLLLAKLLKRPSNRVVLGGATFSVMPHPERLLAGPTRIVLQSGPHDLDPRPFVNGLVLGEGERPLEALVSSPLGSLSDIPGLVFEHNGSVMSNPGQGIEDLDQLPCPDFGDFPLRKYHSPLPVLPYLSSRGCFWNRCSFCTHSKTYFSYREESAEKTVENLAFLKDRWGVQHFALVDEMIHPARFRRLGRLMIDRKLEIGYSAYARPGGGFRPQVLQTIAKSGLRVMMWGVETASQRLLDLMKKGVKAEGVRKVLRDAHEAGIWNLLFLMFGFPTESREEWEQTLEFVRRNREYIDAVSRSRFVLLAGSRMMEEPSAYGIVRVMDRPRRDPISVAYDYETCRGLKPEEIETKFRESASAAGLDGRSPFFGIFRDHLLLHAARRENSGRCCDSPGEMPGDPGRVRLSGDG